MKLIKSPEVRILFVVLLGLSLLWPLAISAAEPDPDRYLPDRYGLAVMAGTTYDPDNDIRLGMLSGFALFDYDKIWKHAAPAPLRFKVEWNAGIGKDEDDHAKLITSVNIMALRFVERFSSNRFAPFVEAGIGLIYTDFRVKGQGLRLNFNPQLGIGTEFKTLSDHVYFATFRLHHISNGGLHEDNRGINSAVLLLGRFF